MNNSIYNVDLIDQYKLSYGNRPNFENIKVYDGHIRDDGVNYYSYALYPGDYSPSGRINFTSWCSFPNEILFDDYREQLFDDPSKTPNIKM